MHGGKAWFNPGVSSSLCPTNIRKQEIFYTHRLPDFQCSLAERFSRFEIAALPMQYRQIVERAGHSCVCRSEHIFPDLQSLLQYPNRLLEAALFSVDDSQDVEQSGQVRVIASRLLLQLLHGLATEWDGHFRLSLQTDKSVTLRKPNAKLGTQG